MAELERRYGPRSALWTYTNAAGEPVGLVVRWNRPPKEPGGEPGKEIQPVSKLAGGWANKGMPTPRPLYGLPDLLTTPAARVFIVEGEKAADAARAVGLVATTSPHGSKSANKADWSPLSGRDVVVLPDHDDAGERYALDVARLATAAGAKSVRVVRLVELWAGMPEGGDMADLIDHRGGDVGPIRADVEALANRTAPTKPTPAPIDGAPVVVRLSDVKPEPVAWLWPGRFALGKLTLIAGDPGLGKSFLTLDMASRVSTGAGWPDRRGESFTPGGVVLLSAEDAIADTIRPRLDAAGADVSRIVALEAIRSVGDNGRESARTFDLSRDLPALEAAIRSVEGCRLVVIDPVTAYLGGTDSHKNSDIRGLLAPLAELAARHRVAVVAVTHLNKSGGGSAIYRTMGSLAFVAAARAAWAVVADKAEPGRRLLLPIKNNLSANRGGLAYSFVDSPGHDQPQLAWEEGAVTLSADDALAVERGGERSVVDDAADWLREQLADGPRRMRDVEGDAREAGYSVAALRRAKAALHVASRKPVFGGPWEWALPAEGAHPPKVRTPCPSPVRTFGWEAGNGVFGGVETPSAPEGAQTPETGGHAHLRLVEDDLDGCSDYPDDGGGAP
ncbi:MAG TPA: AAA family ATPase [Phycisphaerales bacterium]|nr:AAA family ATPase [Phycisphaerales bacterium]